MSEQRQLDLFATTGIGTAPRTPSGVQRRHVAASELDDHALIAAIPIASLADYRDLADEVARRRLVSAMPSLEALCRRFRGLGIEKPIPEQIAALETLAGLGARDKTALKSGLTFYMRSLQRCPAKVRTFFQAPTVQYAA